MDDNLADLTCLLGGYERTFLLQCLSQSHSDHWARESAATQLLVSELTEFSLVDSSPSSLLFVNCGRLAAASFCNFRIWLAQMIK